MIADFPCNECPMVHSVDLAYGAVSIELPDRTEVAARDLLLLDQHSALVTSVRVVLGDVPERRGFVGSEGTEAQVAEFHLAAKRRGRGNRWRRPSLDSGLAVTTRLAELSAGRLYVDRHNLECPRPLCITCRRTLPLRTISIRETDCWDCGQLSKIALGTIDTKILYADDFTHDEREFAIAYGSVTLSIQSSSAFGDQYLASVCGECGSVQGDWTLDVDVHQRTMMASSNRRSQFGPCSNCAVAT